MKGRIFDIKRFAVHDGNGIRTTVFLKGCPLKCVWCHNPEGIAFQNQLAYYAHKCMHCGACVPICKEGAHAIGQEGHLFLREKCTACGACAETCPGTAMTAYGKEVTVEELLPQLLEDRDFYETSGGGITLSGGECLMQPDFCAQVLKRCKALGIHTAVDTCGFVARESLDQVIPYTDQFLYDMKAMDEDVHIKCTGRSNKIILDNLTYLDSQNCNIEVRIPYVPGWNAGQIPKMAEFLKTLNHVTKVRILPYHNYAASKYEALAMENTLPDQLPTDEEIKTAEARMKR